MVDESARDSEPTVVETATVTLAPRVGSTIRFETAVFHGFHVMHDHGVVTMELDGRRIAGHEAEHPTVRPTLMELLELIAEHRDLGLIRREVDETDLEQLARLLDTIYRTPRGKPQYGRTIEAGARAAQDLWAAIKDISTMAAGVERQIRHKVMELRRKLGQVRPHPR